MPHLPLQGALGGAHHLHAVRRVRDQGQVCLQGVHQHTVQVQFLLQLRGG